jgi:hypothetical protein
LDRGFRIVAGNEEFIYVQKDAEAFYCYGNPAPDLPWLCLDMRKLRPALEKELLKDLPK